MNKKLNAFAGLFIAAIVLSFGVSSCGVKNDSSGEEVVRIVKAFGDNLKNVSLLAPPDILLKSMREHYGETVTEVLIQRWLSDPVNAPGRLTSSPYPDRIDVIKTTGISKKEYKVEGNIIEAASTEKTVTKRPVTLTLKKTGDKWLIHDVVLGGYE
jgi:hypothetical protein